MVNFKQLAETLPCRLITANDGTPLITRYKLWGTFALPGDDDPTVVSSCFLHEFHNPDSDRYMHNHPWEWSHSTVLHGYVKEERAETTGYRDLFVYCRMSSIHYHHKGDTTVYKPTDYHRVLEVGDNTWTLFTVGRSTGRWGFWISDKRKYIPWQEYCK